VPRLRPLDTGEIVLRLSSMVGSRQLKTSSQLTHSFERCPTRFTQHWRTSTHATDQLGWRCTVWTHLTQPEPCVISTTTQWSNC